MTERGPRPHLAGDPLLLFASVGVFLAKPSDSAPSLDDRALLLVGVANGGELSTSDLLVDVIHRLREGVEAGEDDATLVTRLGPRLERIVGKRAAAATLGRLGGRARAAKLSASRRAEIARRAAAARWARQRGESA